MIRGVTDYGDQRFISIVNKGNITGVQFHPEKSGSVGLRFLRDYLSQCTRPVSEGVLPTTIEDFGELQALPSTTPSCRVAAVASVDHTAAQLYQDGADEVRRTRTT